MASNASDPASELARVDEARSLLAQLLQLTTQREAALAAQTEGLRVPPRASDAGEGSSLLLSSAMEDQPNFLASSSLLGPPPGTQVLEARTEERFQRLAQARAYTHTHTPRPQPAPPHPLVPVQLDEAIAHLEVLAAAAPASGGSSSAGQPCAAAGARRPRLGLAVRQFRELSGADSELAAGLHGAAAGVRRAADADAPDCLLPAGSVLFRPFLSQPARKRMRQARPLAARLTPP